MVEWQIIDTGTRSAEENMALDAKMLEDLCDKPILHLYDWAAPSATFGYFLNPFDHIKESGVKKHGLALARRPTGGGLIFHLTDLAFSALIPSSHPAFSLNPLDNYIFMNSIVKDALDGLQVHTHPSLFCECATGTPPFCMAKPTQYDVMIGGKKVGGAAQRKTKKGYLHQGSISIAPPPQFLADFVSEEVLNAMKETSVFLFPSLKTLDELQDARQLVRDRLVENCRFR